MCRFGVAYTVVGVLPQFFNFLGSTDLFTPVQYNQPPRRSPFKIEMI